ncbi:hypothetical protein ACJMK2_035757 [Sinanodonta woodiana]|uniref:Uncharacterized protein n=1 Tax=Sinanodonta woodiana TaxID=1069815 RepID=A0ABD3WF15_SINWO
MRYLPSLSFVPVEDVVLPVLDYFEDTWVGRPTRGNKRRPPRTPHSMCGCYDNINDELPKTNNSSSRIKKIVETEKEIDLMDYLRGLPHNLSF